MNGTAPLTPLQTEPVELICSEVWGGNRPADAEVRLPGMKGLVYSHPCGGTRGGDVHYITTCSSGMISRVCLADVVGHGEQVSRVSGHLHRLLRRQMSTFDPRRILAKLNVDMAREGLAAMTTAACLSYDATTGALSYCYAGHPPAWVWRRTDDAWEELRLAAGNPEAEPGADARSLSNLPLGVRPDTHFERARVTLRPGDRILAISDGILEARDRKDELFGSSRLRDALTRHRHRNFLELGRAVLETVFEFADQKPLQHDDVTLILLEIGPKRNGPKLWYVIANQTRRLLASRRR